MIVDTVVLKTDRCNYFLGNIIITQSRKKMVMRARPFD